MVGNLKSALLYESVRTRNLIDVANLYKGELVKGSYTQTGDKYVSDYIPVEANTRYYFSGNCTNTECEIALYDASHTYLTRKFGTNIITTFDTAYARVEFNQDVAQPLVRVQFEKNTVTDYVYAYEAPDISLRYAIKTPEMYGAVGDGTQDDSAAFTAALSGGNVFLVGAPGKTYRINSPIQLHSHTRLSNLNIRDYVASGNSVFYAENVIDICIENLYICADSVSYSSSKETFSFRGCENVTLRNIVSSRTESSAFIRFYACNNVYVKRIILGNYYEFGISCLEETGGIIIEDCDIKNCDSGETYNYGIVAYGVYGSEATTSADFIYVKNNKVSNFRWTAIDAHGGYDIQFIGNTVNQGGEESHRLHIGINVGDNRAQTDRILVCENTITGNGNASAYALSVSNAKNAIVAKNVVTNWSKGQSTAGLTSAIFYLVQSEQVKCSGNIVNDFVCPLLLATGRNIEFEDNLARFAEENTLFDNVPVYSINGGGELIVKNNTILFIPKKFAQAEVISTGRYHPHPLVKDNVFDSVDPSVTRLALTSSSYVTVEDFKYSDEGVPGVTYGRYNDTIYSTSGKLWRCTKSYYTDDSPAEWIALT